MPDTDKLLARGFRPYRKITVTFARQMNRRFRVQLASGDVLHGQPGDYGCISPDDGSKWIVARKVFEETYAPARIKPADQTDRHARLLRSGFRPYRKHQITWAKKLNRPMRIPTLEGDVMAQPGDYLCIGPKGEPWPQPSDRFEAHYRPAAIPARSR
jgi:hypothetical protein